MKVFFDTNVLIAAVMAEHEAHERCFVVLEKARSGKDEGIVAAHSLAEMYSVLTKAPLPFRHSPPQALLSIEENVVKHCTLSVLSGTDYTTLLRDSAMAGVEGGMVYDALLMRAAQKAHVQRIYTLNLKHFRRVAAESLSLLATP